ncbi:hypothetical protein NDQ41_08605, partial [Alcaligenes faecalis]|nr:hypothetical protein [Alcaligenes faecalis]
MRRHRRGLRHALAGLRTLGLDTESWRPDPAIHSGRRPASLGSRRQSPEQRHPHCHPHEFSYHYNKDMVVSTQEVADYIKNGQAPVLLDARPTEFF